MTTTTTTTATQEILERSNLFACIQTLPGGMRLHFAIKNGVLLPRHDAEMVLVKAWPHLKEWRQKGVFAAESQMVDLRDWGLLVWPVFAVRRSDWPACTVTTVLRSVRVQEGSQVSWTWIPHEPEPIAKRPPERFVAFPTNTAYRGLIVTTATGELVGWPWRTGSRENGHEYLAVLTLDGSWYHGILSRHVAEEGVTFRRYTQQPPDLARFNGWLAGGHLEPVGNELDRGPVAHNEPKEI